MKAKPKTRSVVFTRSEFSLLASLVEDETRTDRAKLNERYSTLMEELQSRLEAVTYATDKAFPTDNVKVLA